MLFLGGVGDRTQGLPQVRQVSPLPLINVPQLLSGLRVWKRLELRGKLPEKSQGAACWACQSGPSPTLSCLGEDGCSG